jgi:parallel beta-helix repeat protein
MSNLVVCIECENFTLTNSKIFNHEGILLLYSDNFYIGNNIFSDGNNGISLANSNNGKVTSNKIERNDHAMSISKSNNIEVINNKFIGNYNVANIYSSNGNIFEKNTIEGTGRKILYLHGTSDNNIFKYNTIKNNYPELPLGLLNIERDSTNTVFNYNNIYDNNIYPSWPVIRLNHNGNDVDARYNYWGTTDLTQISEIIEDFFDDPSLGIIHFKPILNEPYTPEQADGRTKVKPKVNF